MPVLPGPNGPIRYTRDALGYPSIEARDDLDAVWALGWFHARDRGLQVYLSLAAARGQLLSILGENPLARLVDQSVRLFRFSHDLDAQVQQISPDALRWIAAYSAGFEAGLTRRTRLLLRVMGAPATPLGQREIVLIYRLGIFFGLTSSLLMRELVLGELLAGGASDAALELLGGPAAVPPDRAALAGLRWPDALRLLAQPTGQGGSNAFAVMPARSATGGALLCTEPHMEISRLPPLLYAATLRTPAGQLMGASPPGVPWFSVGRNARVAWGLTFAHGDNVDVVVERTEEGRYLTAGGWRTWTRREERVAIRGKPPESWVFHDNETASAVGELTPLTPALRWSGLERSGQDVDTLIRLQRANSVDEGAAGARALAAFTVHVVLADADGHVGLAMSGQQDQRPDGLTGAAPIPGWLYPQRPPPPMPDASRPGVMDPPEGVLASANERRDGPAGELWNPLCEGPYRYQRLNTLLASRERWDLQGLAGLCYDEGDECAARLAPVWAGLLPDEPVAQDLLTWARDQAAVSREIHREWMGLFHAWHEEATRRLLRHHLGGQGDALLDGLGLGLYLQRATDDALALERPGVVGPEALRPMLREALDAARARPPEARPVPPRVPFKHLLFQDKLPAFLGFHADGVVVPGGPTSPFQSRVIRILGETVLGGPALHMVFDLSQPGGWYNFPGGASEQRFGPGFGKGLRDWAEGCFLPMGEPPGEAPRVSPGVRR